MATKGKTIRCKDAVACGASQDLSIEDIEGAGVVESVGGGVTNVEKGDHIIVL